MSGGLGRRSLLIWGLFSGVFLAVAIPSMAVGSNFPTREVVEPVKWQFPLIGAIAGTNSVVLDVNSATCGGPTIDHVEVRSGPKLHDHFTATIVVYGRYVITEFPPPRHGVIYSCGGVGGR